MRRTFAALVVAATATLEFAAPASAATAGGYLVALHGNPSPASTIQAADLTDRYGGDVRHVYSAALRGFSVTMTEAQAKRLAADPSVRYVERDGTATATETWGLDRVDQRTLPLDDGYTAPNDGSGATVYVVDTGMDLDHPDYGGRARSGYDFIDDDTDASDCAGHGTHVGGTVGSATWGVAKNVTLVSVRVLGCDGSGAWDQVIAGIDWVTRNAPEAAVGNMSLGGSRSTAVNEAVANSIDAGVAWAVAAGNEGQDACDVSPASVPDALTVAASDSADRRSLFSAGSSNYGDCVDLFAPGSAVTSTTNGGGSGGMSGTSMATPHVAGALALAVTTNPAATVADLNGAIADSATPDVISDVRGSPNRLLYVGDL